MESYSMLMEWKNICKCPYYPKKPTDSTQSLLKFQWHLSHKQNNFKICMKLRKSLNSQGNLFFFFWFFCIGSSLLHTGFSCSEQELLFIMVHGLLIAVASLVAEHGLLVCRLSSCSSQALERRLSSCGARA